ncbi:PA14 domain-containing protein [Hymenobacter puniceus]|uniref:PA14 domain-containing protein n=1 Tax=Hymenobacter sp. BT190 TaxID=2763505 RepID=UPI0016511592|nr:PA14 domain-containing protein [Hymenobacter sp. BT190]MBC6699840.1 T9SS type A sorting domain-containing protein [Hymenobacter sp. BT190]
MKTSSTIPPLFGSVRLLLMWLLLSSGLEALAQPSGCGGQNPGGSPAGTGLYAEYYSGYFDDDQRFFTSRTPGLVRIDAQANFLNGGFGDLTTVAANTLANPDGFSLRQRGSLAITTAGMYTFYLYSDDAAYFWLDNEALASPAVSGQATIANGGLHSASVAQQASVYLVAGLHNVLLHYGEMGSDNTLVLEYQGPDSPTRQVVPASVFCTATQPVRILPANLVYPSANQTVAVGTGTVSSVPTVAVVGGPPQFLLANRASLPTGIEVNPTTGQITFGVNVPSGLYQPNILVISSQGATLFRQAYTFVAALTPTASCISPRPDRGPPTQGLYAEYYPGYFRDDPAYFTVNQPRLVRLESQLNYDTDASWGDLTAAASGTTQDANEYSARLRGSFTINTAGIYTLYLRSDDGSWLWLDNAALVPGPPSSLATINNGGLHADSTVAVTLPLFAGQHDLQIHFGENGGRNKLVLEYEGPDAPTRRVMPSGIFCSGGSGRPLRVRTAARQVSLQVAPNPNKGSFGVHIGQQQPGPGTLQLLDMQGRLCYQTSLLVAAEQQLQLQLPGLAAGVYVVRLTTEKGAATHRVVVE